MSIDDLAIERAKRPAGMLSGNAVAPDPYAEFIGKDVAAIREKYGDGSLYGATVRAADAEIIERRWATTKADEVKA